MARLVDGERVVHINDIADDKAYRAGDPIRRAFVEIGGFRTLLGVALEREGALLGALHVYRREVRPFSEKQIALLENFAAQAVIAMENARLITETREALEQQTATAEVLRVINSSPGDLAPVFEAMLEKATDLCGAALGVMRTFDGEHLHTAASRGASAALVDFLRRPLKPVPGTLLERFVRGDAVVESVLDITEHETRRTSTGPALRALMEFAGARSYASVALRKDDALLGIISLYRQEARPFTDKQVSLLQNFAAQAVIAMENARLINETREALEQQTATAEVLGVINSSPGDLAPVFEAMLEKATRICDASFGIMWQFSEGMVQPNALYRVPPAFAEFWDDPRQPSPESGPGRLIRGESAFALDDLMDLPGYKAGDPMTRAIVELAGARSVIIAPLRKDANAIGAITIYRQEVRPFTGNQITLLENFAAQAVVAMENARLLDEIRQRQAELRVTFDNMGDGVVMFDEGLHLAAWNRNFQEMLDLPDTLLTARPSYADYLSLLAERGEFGSEDIEAELKRRLENMEQEFRQERTRPDGRVIEVRRNAVPDGGFVLIYSDITERKRSEAEIRAARDAAEAAYRDLKAAQANLIQAEKMASLGQLTAGIAHEIKNPLNFVNNFAGLSVELLDELKETAAPAITALDDDKRAEIDETIEMLTGNLEKIAEHGRRADNIVKSMLEHSRSSSGERRSVVNGLVEEALNLAYHGARAQDQSFNITLERDYAESLSPIELVPQD